MIAILTSNRLDEEDRLIDESFFHEAELSAVDRQGLKIAPAELFVKPRGGRVEVEPRLTVVAGQAS